MDAAADLDRFDDDVESVSVTEEIEQDKELSKLRKAVEGGEEDDLSLKKRKVHAEGGVTEYVVTGGFAEVSDTGTTVLAEQAMGRDDVTRDRRIDLVLN